jgi:Peptidase family M28/PDZ domain
LTMQANAQITTRKIKKHIHYLASDKLEGRGTGTIGCEKAALYIAKQFNKIGLQPKGTEQYFHPFHFKKAKNPHGGDDSESPEIYSQNVVGYLDNNAEFTIVIGAHYDHLGKGQDGNSLDANPQGKIHNGADDNASGTAGVIELARHFVNNQRKEPFNFLFICFSGEELGLIGSKKFCETPTISLDKMSYMINMDMIGRYRDDKGIMIHGVGTSPLWIPLLGVVKTDLKVKTDSSGTGPSDFTSFYLKNLPVLGFFTGQHAEYHKPTDDVAWINYEGEKRVLEYIIKIVDGTCTFPKPDFTPTRQQNTAGRSFKVTLGLMPDYAFDGKGMKVDGVTMGKPAEKAGIKVGDIIIQLGEYQVENVYNYMDALGKFQKGTASTVTIKRGAEEMILKIVF